MRAGRAKAPLSSEQVHERRIRNLSRPCSELRELLRDLFAGVVYESSALSAPQTIVSTCCENLSSTPEIGERRLACTDAAARLCSLNG